MDTVKILNEMYFSTAVRFIDSKHRSEMDAITVGFFMVASILVVGLMLFMFKSFGKEKDLEEVWLFFCH